ncbi:IS5 family transposase [Streptomyces sp. CB00455]|uniref:IS5 family transposase n=1 Tax=Streptomyces sp. CB00455 TaxID=1703927 RepID=UPI0018FE73F3|nr:IS5 family transposase [Streptomyces sp. CB00455]
MIERLVPDELWELFQRVVAEAPSRPQGGGRRRHGDREVLAAILFVATSGCTWQQLPTASFGPSGATAHRRFSEWTKARVWAKLHRLVLDELGARGELDWSRCAIDSVNMRALKKGDLTGPNPVDRGKFGSKIHLITERTGLPLAVGISGANLHDSQALQPLVRGIPPIRSHRGPRRRRPGKLHGDKGYDYAHLRRWLRNRGIRHRIARKGIEPANRLGRHRWVVERTVSWLSGCRRLHRRYERKAEHFLAFAGIAAALICYRRLKMNAKPAPRLLQNGSSERIG